MRRAKPLSEVWIRFERQKIDNKYMAKCKYCQTNFIRETRKKTVFFILVVFFRKKTGFFSTGKKPFTSLIGYNFGSNCHRDFKLGSYFSLRKAVLNMTLTLNSSPKVKILETPIKEN